MQIGDLVRQFVSTQTSSDGRAARGAKNTERTPQPSASRGTVDTSSLQKGQTFEGNVSAIKGDKVTLTLSNGGTVTARLAADVPIQEGESVFFEVKSNDGSMVNIRPVSVGAMQNPILMSALSSAGLPQNESNFQMVNAMMQEQLPVDAKSLADMARAVATHPQTDVSTLVTMQKVGLPLTDEMIQQFSNYKESEGAILDTVTELVDGMAEAFSAPDVTAQDVTAFTKNLMAILTTEDGVMPHLFDGEGNQLLAPPEGEGVPVEPASIGLEGEEGQPIQASVTEGDDAAVSPATVVPEGGASVSGAEAEGAQTRTAVAAEGAQQAATVSDGENTQSGSTTAVQAAAEGTSQAGDNGGAVLIGKTDSLTRQGDAAFAQGAGIEIGSETKESLLEKLESIKQELAGLKGETETAGRPEQAGTEGRAAVSGQEEPAPAKAVVTGMEQDPELMKVLAETPGREEISYPKHSIGDTLDPAAQKELASLVKELGVPTEGLADEQGGLRPETGTAKLAQAIVEHLAKQTQLPKDAVMKLLSAEPFKEVLKDAMSQKWTLPPEKVADKDAVKNLYAKLSVDMERLAQVASEAAKGPNPVSGAAESIKNNVDFINQLNQAYTYIQLPLKLSGQQATGDLYVYSNKKRRIGEDDELSAFLHFDLQHLGSTDISVKLKNKKVSTDFYMADDVSFALIQKNLPLLQEKLERLGYTATLNVSKDDKAEPVDFVEDFLKQGLSAGGGIRRYSFDMTA